MEKKKYNKSKRNRTKLSRYMRVIKMMPSAINRVRRH